MNFGAKEFFNMNFDYKNGCKNEFKDNNEKSCSWSRNRVSPKIDFEAQWLHNGHADSVGVKKTFQQFDIFISKFIGNWNFLMGFRIFSETLEFF